MGLCRFLEERRLVLFSSRKRCAIWYDIHIFAWSEEMPQGEYGKQCVEKWW